MLARDSLRTTILPYGRIESAPFAAPVRAGNESLIIPPAPERIVVGNAAPRRRPGIPPSARRRGIDRTGPVFLFMLLCAGFIPSVLGDFDTARFLRLLQDAALAFCSPSPSIQAGDQRQGGHALEPICGSAGFQVADSAAVAMCCLSLPAASASRARRGVQRRRGKRRALGALKPRAPPFPSSSLSDHARG
jgi:hypothetical protein